jgi:hypothetical protein
LDRVRVKLLYFAWVRESAFVFVERKTRRTRAILGYPTQKLEPAARGS